MRQQAVSLSAVRRDHKIGTWQATEVEEEAAPGGRLRRWWGTRFVQLPVLLIASAIVFGVGAFLTVQLLDDDEGEGALKEEPQGPVVAQSSSDQSPADESAGADREDTERESEATATDPQANPGESATGLLESGEEAPSGSSSTATTSATTSATVEVTTATDPEPAASEPAPDDDDDDDDDDAAANATLPTAAPPTTVAPTTNTQTDPTTPPPPPTTSSTTTTTTTTTIPTTTTATTVRPRPLPTVAPTTIPTTTTPTIPPLPDVLIATPVTGSDQRWDSAVRFSVNDVPTAASYCWTFLPDGHQVCRQRNTFTLPAQSGEVQPGLITVFAEARGAAGERLMTGEARIELTAPVGIVQPAASGWIDVGAQTPIAAKSVPTADRYCWEFIQNGVTISSFCSSNTSLTLSPGGSVLGRLALVPVTIRHTVSRGSVILGEDSVTISVARRL